MKTIIRTTAAAVLTAAALSFTAAAAAPAGAVVAAPACSFSGFGGTIESQTGLYAGVTGGSVQYGEGFSRSAPAGGLLGGSNYTTCFVAKHPPLGTNNDKTFQVVSNGFPVNEYLTEVNNGAGNPSERFNVQGVSGPASTAARWVAVQNSTTGHFNWINEASGDLLVTTLSHSGLATIANPTTSQLNSGPANFEFASGQ